MAESLRVERGAGGCAGAGFHHADDRHVELLLRHGEARRGGRVACDDDELDVLAGEPAADLAHIAAHLVLGARAVGAARAVSQVDDRLAGQLLAY